MQIPRHKEVILGNPQNTYSTGGLRISPSLQGMRCPIYSANCRRDTKRDRLGGGVCGVVLCVVLSTERKHQTPEQSEAEVWGAFLIEQLVVVSGQQ
jgi:hypothetical protein